MATNRPSFQQIARLRQEITANPRLFQAMDFLYMPLHDLSVRLEQELLENPFLELSEVEAEEAIEMEADSSSEDEDPEAEFDWERILLDGFEPGGAPEQSETRERFVPAPVESFHLHDYLREQLILLRLDARQRLIADDIIGNIDDNGILSCELSTVVESLNMVLADSVLMAQEEGMEVEEDEVEIYTDEEVEVVLRQLQSLDPPGVAAQDLRECLLIQLRRAEREDSLAYRIVNEAFDDFINHRKKQVVRAMGRPKSEVQEALDQISKLDPIPGSRFSAAPDQYVMPDLIVERIGDEYLVFLNDTVIPRLRLSRSYQEVVANKDSFKGKNKDFINNKMNAAKWLLQVLERRRQTMLKVMRYIVERQQEFFEKGVQYLRPLTLHEVAQHIEMSDSTVSRVANAKYVQTPSGVFSLKYFFSSGLATATGEAISTRGVKAKLQTLVDEEDPTSPLTDQGIVDLLRGEGVKIARRTVAKYRDQLGIMPTHKRKQL